MAIWSEPQVQTYQAKAAVIMPKNVMRVVESKPNLGASQCAAH